MFDRFIIDPATLRNTGPTNAPTGFSFASKLGYYRGLGLSMIEELNVGVDGKVLPRSSIRFDDGKGALTLDEMETAYDRRWPFGAVATISAEFPGGFPSGEHRLSLQQKLRISYMPLPSFNFDEKTVEILIVQR